MVDQEIIPIERSNWQYYKKSAQNTRLSAETGLVWAVVYYKEVRAWRNE